MKTFPLVSVIMPAYNAAGHIIEAIESIQGQTFINWELLIIDDASGDATVELIKVKAGEDNRIKLLRNKENQGPGNSRNRGIDKAGGDFIAFLDSDDLWLSHKLQTQVDFLLKYDLPMCFSSYYIMNEAGEITKTVKALERLSYEKLLLSNYVGNLTGIYNVNKTGKKYSPPIRKRQDWALWLSILKDAGEMPGIKEPLAIYRLRKGSISNNKTALLKYNFKVYRKVLNFGVLKSYAYMGRFLWEHFMVKNKQIISLDKGSKLP